MSAVLKIVFLLVGVLASSLTRETVTKERLAEKNCPIRVAVFRSVRNAMVTFEFELDQEILGERVTVECIMMNASSKLVAYVPVAIQDEAAIEREDDTDTGIATIQVNPEFASLCDVEISSWVGTAEHKYRILLSLFADEMKNPREPRKKSRGRMR